MSTILIVDDDPAIREVLKLRLQQWGFAVLLAEDGNTARERFRSSKLDLVLCDLVLPDLSGVELMKDLRSRGYREPFVMITAHGAVETAVEAMKEGAQDFITKPIDYGHLKAILEELKHDTELRREARKLSSRLSERCDFGPFVGISRPMKQVYELIEKVGPSDASVLITGASGTGKELVAHTVHNLSGRSSGPFVPVNSAAIPSELMESELFGHEKGSFTGAIKRRAGCFEQADGGTLFLDEISEMATGLQAKLLRVLEDGKVKRLGGREELVLDVRVLAATNRDPATVLEEGKLRRDLFYRLNVFTIHVPTLVDRKADIPRLVQYFIKQFNKKHDSSVDGIAKETRDLLMRYAWPGNVRELRNIVERAVVLASSGWVEARHLPAYFREPGAVVEQISIPAGTPLSEVEKKLILETLKATGDNKAETARQLGVDVKTIRNKLKAYEELE